MTIELKALKELEYRTNRLHNRFNFKTEDTLSKIVSSRNAIDFDSDIDAMKTPANELMFVTTGNNNKKAKEILKTVQNLFLEGSKIILNGGTNKEMNDLVFTETQKNLDLLTIIQNDEDGFKSFVDKERHFFDANYWFVEIAKQISVTNDVAVFVNELNGGDIAIDIKNALINPNKKDIFLYGIDRDIDCGAESREKGIDTARGGIEEASSFWTDICFCANHVVNFKPDTGYFMKTELFKFYQEKLMRKQGIFVFNYPFYRIDDIKTILKNNELVTAIYTNDAVGNVIFIMRYGVSRNYSKNIIQKIQLQPKSLPKTLTKTINYYTKELIEVNTFSGKYTDLKDIQADFVGEEKSSQFLFDYYLPKSKLESIKRPLMEIKPGHIPGLASSEIINGRFVDEILKKKINKEYGFDHLHSTKIVKREVEEKEEKVDKEGNLIVEISRKKSNIIVSTVLTANGDYIELFSNKADEDEEGNKNSKAV